MDPQLRQKLYFQKHKNELRALLVLAIIALPTLILMQTPVSLKQFASEQSTGPLAGDMDHNNILDSNDFEEFLKCYKPTQDKPCTVENRKTADLNHDNKIDGTDYNLLLRNLNNK